MTILDIPILSRIRRNHGLEHATLSILSARFPYRPMAGYTLLNGFLIFGDIPVEHLREAVIQALARMNNGERQLAIHPGCGTNFLASGVVAGLLAWLGMVGAGSKRDKVGRLPSVILLATLGLLAGQPLGALLQKHVTTSGDPEGMTIVNIYPIRIGSFPLHRVITQG